MQIIIKKISDLTPYENNPRNNDMAVEAVAKSILTFGFKVPMVIDTNNVIIAGHTRYKAAIKLNMTEVPCIIADDLTEDQIKAFRLADNKLSEIAEWDENLLNMELDNIEIDMSDFGFDLSAFVEDVKEDDFDVDEALANIIEPVAKLGDVWKLGVHRLMCGDSTKIENVNLLMDGKKAKLVFTDPPWNVNYGADTTHPSYKSRQILNDNMTSEQFTEFLTKAFFCLKEVSEPGCMTYVVMSGKEWGKLMTILEDLEYHWSSTIIWYKDSLVLSRKDYHAQYEPIWYGCQSGYEPIWYGWVDSAKRLCPLEDRKQSDVWEIPRPKISVEHPTMKPVELIARAMNNSSKPKDIIVDLFGGSGTTLIAAEQTDRQSNLMELDPKYCDVIIERWEKLTGKKAELCINTI